MLFRVRKTRMGYKVLKIDVVKDSSALREIIRFI